MKNPAGLLIVVVLVALVYSMMILPQRRQQKARQAMLKDLAPGARILTAGGMYMTVLAVDDKSILARLGQGDGLDIELDHRAVIRVVERAQEPAEVVLPSAD